MLLKKVRVVVGFRSRSRSRSRIFPIPSVMSQAGEVSNAGRENFLTAEADRTLTEMIRNVSETRAVGLVLGPNVLLSRRGGVDALSLHCPLGRLPHQPTPPLSSDPGSHRLRQPQIRLCPVARGVPRRRGR